MSHSLCGEAHARKHLKTLIFRSFGQESIAASAAVFSAGSSVVARDDDDDDDDVSSSLPTTTCPVDCQPSHRQESLPPSRASRDPGTGSAEPEGEVLPEVRADDAEIPAPVGTATKEEFRNRMLRQQNPPAQKLDLVVNLPEGRGLVAREKVNKGESLLEIPDATLITVERAVAESSSAPSTPSSRSGPSSLLSSPSRLWPSRLEVTAGSLPRTFAHFLVAPAALDWPEDDVKTLLAGSPSQRAAYERQAALTPPSRRSAPIPQLTPERCDGLSTFFSRLIRLPSRGGELALVPWADMLNHKPGCEAHIDDSDGQVCLSPDRGYRLGEQVRLLRSASFL